MLSLVIFLWGSLASHVTEPRPMVAASSNPAPVQAPSYAPPPVYTSDVEPWRELVIAVGFPEWTVDAVLRVMSCESKGNPNATGASGEMGLMQIHPRWHSDATYDPEGNLRAAYRISSGGRDWSAWSCKP